MKLSFDLASIPWTPLGWRAWNWQAGPAPETGVSGAADAKRLRYFCGDSGFPVNQTHPAWRHAAAAGGRSRGCICRLQKKISPLRRLHRLDGPRCVSVSVQHLHLGFQRPTQTCCARTEGNTASQVLTRKSDHEQSGRVAGRSGGLRLFGKFRRQSQSRFGSANQAVPDGSPQVTKISSKP